MIILDDNTNLITVRVTFKPGKDAFYKIEKEIILDVMRLNQGNKKATAIDLGITPKTIYNKMLRYNEEDK